MTDARFAPRTGMSRAEIDTTVDAVLAEATLDEKIDMMAGRGFFAAYVADNRRWGARPYRAGGGIDRLGIAPFWFTDGPRGVARGHSTCFPCTMARGASFDVDLEARIGAAMGIEARAQGCDLSGAVCINLLRHPAWGRAQETYGEDSWHLGAMGAALGTGIQSHNVCATVKHFALNSMENSRFKVDVQIDERALHEVYLPHFKHCIDAGIGSVMSAYNKMNGTYCGENPALLTEILRREWGFQGFVHSDWVMGVYDVMGAAAGLDVENPEPRVFGDNLRKAVDDGRIAVEVVETACRRILTSWYRFKCAVDPLPAYPESLVASDAHRALAREAAEKSAVLLANDGSLPLDRSRIGKLAIFGRLAALENTGDNGSSKVQPPYVVTPLAGLTAMLGAERILTADENSQTAAVAAAAEADAIVVVVGTTAQEEGEYIPGDLTFDASKSVAGKRGPIGGDRLNLGLPANQGALINIAAASGKPVIVVIVSGSAIMVEGWHDRVNAILQTFYSGMEGGHALARLLFGDVSPSGKLPFTLARDATHYPFFDRDADRITYDYWHGYTLFDREAHTPRYAYGHGLSYTHFGYRGVKARARGAAIEVEVTIANFGDVAGDEVVQLYVGFPEGPVERPKKLLRGFARVALGAGEQRMVQLTVPYESLRWRDPESHSWRFEHGTYRIYAGGASDRLISASVRI